MNTAMSTKRIAFEEKPREVSSWGLWLLATAAGVGLTCLGITNGNSYAGGAGVALLGSGLLYVNMRYWANFFSHKK